MDDRTLLEDAARAAGIAVEFSVFSDGSFLCFKAGGDCFADEWNPSKDYGDAMQLAASLRLVVDFFEGEVIGPWKVENFEPGDGLGACLAVTRAAAAIGRQMREAGNG